MVSLGERILGVAERLIVESYGRHLGDARVRLDDGDVRREREVLAAEPQLERAWLLEHARAIMLAQHRIVFEERPALEEAKASAVEGVPSWLAAQMLQGLAAYGGGGLQQKSKDELFSNVAVLDGRLVFKDLFCPARRPEIMDTAHLAVATAGRLGVRPQEGGWAWPGAGYRLDSARAAYLLAHADGPAIAARFYRELYGVSASFHLLHNAWWVIFDLGPVDDQAFQQRVELGRRRRLRAALLSGPRSARAAGDRRVVFAHIARRLGTPVAGLVIAQLKAFLELGDFVEARAFKRLRRA